MTSKPELIELSKTVEWFDEENNLVEITRKEASEKIYQKILNRLNFSPHSLIGKVVKITVYEQVQGEEDIQLYIPECWCFAIVQSCVISADQVCDLSITLGSTLILQVSKATRESYNKNGEFSTTGTDYGAYISWLGIRIDLDKESPVEWEAQITSPRYDVCCDLDIEIALETK